MFGRSRVHSFDGRQVFVTGAASKKRAVSPDRAAEAILEGVRRNRYWVYTSPDIRLAHALQRHLPAAYVLVMRAMNAGADRALPAVRQARRTDL